ncbi:MAG: DNA polymerase III subunit delta' [Nitratireductor sp.]|nr:DNA polymerase III subunit delta' [Nitratireductor sp.]MCC0019575.1 DNA polymerase III subunit delta' [Nitratireductor sp.]
MTAADWKVDTWDALDGVADPAAQSGPLIGHEDARAMLARNFASGRMHHAWLLSGPRGIGKASLAFRAAEHFFRNPDQDEAPAAISLVDDSVHSLVAKGGHPNLLVLRRPWDEKSKKFRTAIGVDEVRRTLGFFGTAAERGTWRVCIVDPADDLTNAAANALLKVLEEPPPRTVFFIIAHTPRGLLATIRSRCRTLSLKPLGEDELLQALDNQPAVAGMTDDERRRLAALARGSVRRALLLAGSASIASFETFVHNVEAPAPDWTAIHKLASAISIPSKAGEFDLFIELVYDYLSERISGNGASLASRYRWTGIWEDLQKSVSRMEGWNMDRKQVILGLFDRMQAA